MGYTTEFSGQITIEPPLSEEEISYLKKFNSTRRMACKQGPYYVDRDGFHGQERGPDVIDYNEPPAGQPSLWCQWVPTENGIGIEWDEGEKFYYAPEWMKYLIKHFIGEAPLAKAQLPFLNSHCLNGEIDARGEDSDDRWKLIVKDNEVLIADGQEELAELKKQHPGFTITCDRCGSNRIEIENSLGYSDLSGGWGSIDLKCLDCGNESEIFKNA